MFNTYIKYTMMCHSSIVKNIKNCIVFNVFNVLTLIYIFVIINNIYNKF